MMDGRGKTDDTTRRNMNWILRDWLGHKRHPEADADQRRPEDIVARRFQRRYVTNPPSDRRYSFDMMDENNCLSRQGLAWEQKTVPHCALMWVFGATLGAEERHPFITAAAWGERYLQECSHHNWVQDSLRKWAFDRPKTLLCRLQEPEALAELWWILGRFLAPYERAPTGHFECEILSLTDKQEVIFLSFPDPQACPQAKYLAILLEEVPTKSVEQPVASPEVRCGGIWSYQQDGIDRERGKFFTLHFLPTEKSEFFFDGPGKSWQIDDFTEFIGIIEAML